MAQDGARGRLGPGAEGRARRRAAPARTALQVSGLFKQAGLLATHRGTGMAASTNVVVRAYDALIVGLAIVAGAIFGLMAFFIGVDVLVRNVTGAGLAWVIELMEYAMYVATVFAAPWVLREGAHVCVDVVTSNLPERTRRIVNAFVCLLGSAICFVICYYSALATLKAFERGNHHGDGFPHSAIRPAAVRHEGHRAARNQHFHRLQVGGAFPGDRDVRPGADPDLSANRPMAA